MGKHAIATPPGATPLGLANFDTDGLTVAELGQVNKISLRGDFEAAAINKELNELLGLQGEISPNTYLSNGASTLFWMGPNERLLYTDSNPKSVADRWSSQPATAAVDVSDYYTVLRLSGSKTRDVFASGSPLDVHKEVFAVGQCAQTRFGNASVLISNHADTPVFQVQVRWSFAEYVFEYLKRVADYV